MLQIAGTLLVLTLAGPFASTQDLKAPALPASTSKLSKPAFKRYMEYVGTASDYAKVLETVDDSKDMTKLLSLIHI